jgi:hypothetical protein
MLTLALLAFATVHAQSCDDFASPTAAASVSASALTESSGLAQSRRNPRVWWTHNDSGDSAVLYAFQKNGTYLGASSVGGITATDWEDMSAGPCPTSAGSCLYVGDIGDNSQSRSYVKVYAIPEPLPGATATVEATWRVNYPDGPRNAETLLVHPLTGDIYLVTKDSDGHSGVFRVPDAAADAPSGTSVSAEEVAELDFPTSDPLATGGDWSRDGRSLVIRTYGSIFYWDTDPSDADAHWSDDPIVWDAPSEAQGEAIAWSSLGDLYTTSEGSPMPFNRMRCVAGR